MILSTAYDLPLLGANGQEQLLLLHAETLRRVAVIGAAKKSYIHTVAFHPTELVLAVIADQGGAVLILALDASKRRLSRASQVVRYSNAKVVLIGDTGVGQERTGGTTRE